MSKCEKCSKCKIIEGSKEFFCEASHWYGGDPLGVPDSPSDPFLHCSDYDVDYGTTWRGPIMVHYRTNKRGEIETTEIMDCNGMLPDIKIIDAIELACQVSKQNNPQHVRDLKNKAAMYDMQNPVYEKRPPSQKREKKCIVYVMRDTVRGFHKIGITKSLSSRLSQLKTANPAIEIVTHYNGIDTDEKHLHSVFKEMGKHIDGEWFELDSEDLELISEYFNN